MVDRSTVAVRPEARLLFLKKASDFARAMDLALEEMSFDVAASAASHCVISAADALLANERGVRSRAKEHGAVVALISGLEIPGAGERAALVEGVLALKHVAEYDDRHVTKSEATDAVKRARRFLDWVAPQLKA